MKKQNESKSRALTITITIAAALLLLNFFQLYRTEYVSGRKSPLKVKNEKLASSLNKARTEVNKYKGISENLDKVILEANQKINQQELKIGRLQNEGTKLKDEVITLNSEIKNIQESYLETIDSLLLEVDINNRAFESTIENLEEEIRELNTIVGKATVLLANNIKVTPLKEREHGYAAQTALAKKVAVLKVCMDIQPNANTPKGLHTVYIRVIAPNGQIVYSDTENNLNVKHPVTDEKVAYSFADEVKYKGEELGRCIRIHINEKLSAGVYVVEAFTVENMLGTTTFAVK